MRHGEERIGGTAWAKLNQRVWLDTAGSIVYLAKEIRHGLHRVFRTFVMMRGIVASRDGIHVLTVQLKAIKSPLSQNLADERLVIFHHALLCGTQIEGIPP